MPQPIPTLRNVGRVLAINDQKNFAHSDEEHFNYLAIHPGQDLELLEVHCLDIGTAPGIKIVADTETFLLLNDDDYQRCLLGAAGDLVDESIVSWVIERKNADEVEWHGCITEVALQLENPQRKIVLGYHEREEAEAIAEVLTPTPHLARLNTKAILEADSSGDVYHYQLRYPGDLDDTVLFVRAVDCETGLDYAKSHLRTLRNGAADVEIEGINTGLLAWMA